MKTVSDQEVEAHLRRLNRWWDGKSGIAEATAQWAPRHYLPAVEQLLIDSRLRRAVVLLGPRRVGKTVLIQHLIQRLIDSGVPRTRIGYVEVDHPLLHNQTLESLVGACERASGADGDGPKYLFFDEIQYLRDWERHLKQVVDHRPDLRVLVSGSAAAALKRQSTESGAGRFTDFLLPPLTFPEYLDLIGAHAPIAERAPGAYVVHDIDLLNERFVEYVNFGGYPELAVERRLRDDPERFVKSDIVDKVLLRDLPQLYGITDIQELNALFAQLAYNTAEIVALKPLSERSGVAGATIAKYIEYLEAAFLIKRVFRVDQSGARYKRERSFKVFLTNPAMRTGLFGPMGADDDGFGHLVETAVYAQRFHEEASLHYARFGSADTEVDMVEMSPAQSPRSVIEVKWSDQAIDDQRRIAGVLKFCATNGLSDALVTTRRRFAQKEINGIRINFWPTAAVAFHLGALSVHGRLKQFPPQLELRL
ncbi:MAG: ATP-binding protein [Pseudomonadota bacterium]|jgi:predicted AAA+ superfamily ATPase